jgi:hypothetical protein
VRDCQWCLDVGALKELRVVADLAQAVSKGERRRRGGMLTLRNCMTRFIRLFMPASSVLVALSISSAMETCERRPRYSARWRALMSHRTSIST